MISLFIPITLGRGRIDGAEATRTQVTGAVMLGSAATVVGGCRCLACTFLKELFGVYSPGPGVMVDFFCGKRMVLDLNALLLAASFLKLLEDPQP